MNVRKKIKVGVVGLGNFGNDFMALFVGHPDIEEVVLCDRIEERIAVTKAAHGLTRSYIDYDEMLKQKDIDCVAIFTQRHLHAPMVLKALEAGKHVYSAVPIACSIEEIEQIIEKVKETRLVYMMWRRPVAESGGDSPYVLSHPLHRDAVYLHQRVCHQGVLYGVPRQQRG